MRLAVVAYGEQEGKTWRVLGLRQCEAVIG